MEKKRGGTGIFALLMILLFVAFGVMGYEVRALQEPVPDYSVVIDDSGHSYMINVIALEDGGASVQVDEIIY